MLSNFDWLRRCQTGAELLATLQHLEKQPDLFVFEEVGPPHTGVAGPCQRCWIYPRWTSPVTPTDGPNPTPKVKTSLYCKACRAIIGRSRTLSNLSRQATVIWGRTAPMPKQVTAGRSAPNSPLLGVYVHDSQHFLVALRRRDLKSWLQELAIYYGPELRGLLQVMPTTGIKTGLKMSDVLCRVIHQEGRFPLDRLRIRFYSAAHQVLYAHTREQLGLLTFEAADFIGLLEMAAVFRSYLAPETQEVLRELLNLQDPAEEQFYWGRFMGYLSPEARDMLNAWQIRTWSRQRIKLLYTLTNYVDFRPTH